MIGSIANIRSLSIAEFPIIHGKGSVTVNHMLDKSIISSILVRLFDFNEISNV